MKIIRTGYTRIVILAGCLAFKIPNFLYDYRCFLWGLLNNHSEAKVSKINTLKDRVCPVLFHLPLGLLVVMPRVDILTDDEYQRNREYIDKMLIVSDDCVISAESKSDSFGYYKGKIVVIDYGA